MMTMTTDETKMIACPDQETLASYLGGWVDDEQSSAIEQHLEDCDACQAVIARVEVEPDSMLDRLNLHGEEQTTKGRAKDSAVDYAISVIQRLPAADQQDRDAEPPSDLLGRLSERMIGPYQLIRPLGHGGMGSVYLAKHCKLDKLVAIKVLPSRWLGSEVHLSRFQREIRAAGGLNHPSIVTATDAGQEDDIYYLVMEYIEGYDFSRVARLCGTLSVADACEAMRRVAMGLSHAHSLGIVHRDVKPSNLMLSQAGDVKILDFGLARHSLWDEASAELTTVGQLMGTLDYMAPEQAECAAAVDYRADLYSLGATLFRLLVGRPPLAAAPDLSPLAKLKLLASHDSPRADTLRPDLPKELTNFIASLLHRDPNRRPASAAHVAEKLEEFAVGHDLSAVAESAKQKEKSDPRPESVSQVQEPGKTVKPAVQPMMVGGGRNGWGWAVALAGFSGLVLAGILLVIETQKGQLVIESEAENVSVKLLADGEEYDTVKVQPGATATKLFAGKYEIVIEGASDDLLIDNESVVIRRGETVIAKIGHSNAAVPTKPVSMPLADEPVYEGKPLSVWLNQVATERSSEQLYNALQAVKKLVGPNNAETVRNSLMDTMETVPNQKIGSDRVTSQLDFEVMGIVRDSFNDESELFQYMVEVLKNGSKSLDERIYPVLYRYDPENAIPLVEYLVNEFFPNEVDEQVVLPAARYARNYLIVNRETAKELHQKLANALYANERLGLEFWLEYLPTDNFYGYAEVVQQKAIEALGTDGISDALLTQAAIMLTEFQNDGEVVQVPLSDDEKKRVAELVAGQLERLASQPDSLLRLVDVNNSYSDFVVPKHNSLPFYLSGITSVVVGRKEAENASPVIEFLQLAESIGMSEVTDESVEKTVGTLRDHAYRILMQLNPSDARARSLTHGIAWPELSINTRNVRPGVSPEAVTFSRDEILRYLFYIGGYYALSDEVREKEKESFAAYYAAERVETFFDRIDRNADGEISKEELSGENDFARYDQDGDGVISKKELADLIKQRFLENGGDLGIDVAGSIDSRSVDPKYISYAERIIGRYDKNNDGELTRDEWKEMPTRGNVNFSGVDLNGDGMVSAEEYAAWMQASANSPGR